MKSTIIAIAQREADQAADRASAPEDVAAIYFETVTETRKRGLKAEEILEAGLVSPNGGPGQYDVKSQNGGGTYTVNVYAGTCDCPDRTCRGAYCKHLQAAEMYEALHGPAQDPLTEANDQQVILEVVGYARGRQLLDKRLQRVRVNGDGYREATNPSFDEAIGWLMGEGYELAEVVKPPVKMGTVTVRYRYTRPGA